MTKLTRNSRNLTLVILDSTKTSQELERLREAVPHSTVTTRIEYNPRVREPRGDHTTSTSRTLLSSLSKRIEYTPVVYATDILFHHSAVLGPEHYVRSNPCVY